MRDVSKEQGTYVEMMVFERYGSSAIERVTLDTLVNFGGVIYQGTDGLGRQ